MNRASSSATSGVTNRASSSTKSGVTNRTTAPKKRSTMKRTNYATQKKRRRREVNNDFEKAFASVPIVEQVKQTQGTGNICSVGAECKNGHIKGTMKCHGDGCDHRIHHLCAIMRNLLDKDNELNVYCSTKCVPK